MESMEAIRSFSSKRSGPAREAQPFVEAREQIVRLENVLAAIIFGETKGLNATQERWVRAARAKMTDREAAAFPKMGSDEIYALARALHERAQEDPATRYGADAGQRLAA